MATLLLYFSPKSNSDQFGGNQMSAFRILLSAFIVAIVSFTSIVIYRHGLNLFPIFFQDILAVTWPGQFNLDFFCFLLLSGLWISWRHHFSLSGFFFGALGVFGGIMFLAPYLLIVSFRADGDVKKMLLGKIRAGESI